MTDAPPSATDVLIVGAGIAGASLAAALAPWRRVLLAEAEDAPGYHATGRSAAFWHESYGGVGVQPLTHASLEMLNSPPPEFSDHGFLSPRGALTLGQRSEAAAVDAFTAEFTAHTCPLVCAMWMGRVAETRSSSAAASGWPGK